LPELYGFVVSEIKCVLQKAWCHCDPSAAASRRRLSGRVFRLRRWKFV